MTDDIVTRLRAYILALNVKEMPQAFIDMNEAANEIERLRKVSQDQSATIRHLAMKMERMMESIYD